MSNKLSLSLLVGKLEKDIQSIISYFIKKTNILPKLCVILIGDNKESQIYVNKKIQKAQEIGFQIELVKLPKIIDKLAIVELIERLNYDNSVHGILIQLPLPIDLQKSTLDILNKVSPEKDIDGLTSVNSGLLNTLNYHSYDHDIIKNIISFIDSKKIQNTESIDANINTNIDLNDDFTLNHIENFDKNYKYDNLSVNIKSFLVNFGAKNPIIPCTPLGVFYIIKRFFKNETLEGKTAVIFGNSNLVGKPLTRILLNNKITTTVCDSKTINGEHFSQNADIIILATGKKNFFNEKFFNSSKKQIVCDVGISSTEDSKITGDLSNDIKNNKNFNILNYTPVPFGIGKMTINTLMLNLLLIYISTLFKKNQL